MPSHFNRMAMSSRWRCRVTSPPLLPAPRRARLQTNRHSSTASHIMREFFRGWRRKLGVVALMVSCVFAAGWVRSCSVEDRIYLPKRVKNFWIANADAIVSYDHSLAWMSEGSDAAQMGWHWPKWQSKSKADVVRHAEKYPAQIEEIRFLGFGQKTESFGFYFGSRTFAPYWSIVIPLTLISGWLLVSQPRESHPKKTPIGPIPEWIVEACGNS